MLEQRTIDGHPDGLGERVAERRHDDHQRYEHGEQRNDGDVGHGERESDRERDDEREPGDADVDRECTCPVALLPLEVQSAARAVRLRFSLAFLDLPALMQI